MIAWLIALVAKKVGETFAPVIVWGVVVLVAVVAVGTVWQTTVRGPYIADGKAAQEKADKPIIAKLTLERDQARADLAAVTTERDAMKAANDKLGADVAELRGRVDEQTAAIKRYQAAIAKAKAEATAAKQAAQRAADDAAAEINRLAALAAGPAIQNAAAAAQQILDDLADYVRQP